MSITLQKSDGDLWLDPETGRPNVVTGANKVDQELADLYLSDYDSIRKWGASLSLESVGNATLEQTRAIMFLRLQQANDRILSKQSSDTTLTIEEQISQFSQADVIVDTVNQAIIFFSVADIGNTSVAKTIGIGFKPTSLKQVIAPPISIIASN